LIGFWYERKSASDAASKAFIVNRVGDAGFLLGLFLMWSTLGSFRFAEVFGRAAQDLAAGSAIPTLITLGLFVGAMGKSAQFPLSVWLPDAMEGPTPTSALIHAATMVTAGVYMVVRSSPLFNLAPDTLNVVAGVGAATAVFAASIGFVQQNIKQTIAYSTITQLGLMFMAAGLGAYATAIFHLFTHAFFKSLLFLGAGSVIQALHGEHDVRRMGGLAPHMRLTAYAFLVGVLATAGIFPLAGFWSQSHIFFTAFDAGRYFLWVLSLFAALLTAFYMFRLYLLTFHGRYRGDARTVHHLRKAPANIWIPLVILALFSVIAGFVGVTPEPGAFQRFLGQTSPLGGQGPGGPLRTLTVLLPLGVASVGVGLAYLSYVQWWDVRTRCATLYVILYRRYFVDEIYSAIFLNGLRRFCHRLAALDGRVIDTAVNRVAGLVVATGRVSSRIDETVINAAVDKSADFTLSWSARTSRFDRRVIDGTVDKVAEWSLGLGHVSSRVDQGLIDGAVNRIADIIQRCSATWRYLQTGVMQNYILAMAVGILLVAVAYVLHSFISFAGESVP
jgi:NADH-quinone oxidoreductase subunit L